MRIGPPRRGVSSPSHATRPPAALALTFAERSSGAIFEAAGRRLRAAWGPSDGAVNDVCEYLDIEAFGHVDHDAAPVVFQHERGGPDRGVDVKSDDINVRRGRRLGGGVKFVPEHVAAGVTGVRGDRHRLPRRIVELVLGATSRFHNNHDTSLSRLSIA